MDHSDRKFESLQRRTDELYRQSAEVTSSVAHNEAALATAVESTPARARPKRWLRRMFRSAGRASERRRISPGC